MQTTTKSMKRNLGGIQARIIVIVLNLSNLADGIASDLDFKYF